MLKRWMFIGTLLIFLLAACGSNATSTPPTEQSVQEESTPTREARTGQQPFNVTISGDAESQIPPGSAQAEFYSSPDPHYELLFGDMSHNIFFILDDNIATGTHALAVLDDLAPDQDAVVEVSIAVNEDDLARGAEYYTNQVDGTITLESIGETISGSFEFTAVYINTDANNQEIRKSVSVQGTFTDLAVRQAQ